MKKRMCSAIWMGIMIGLFLLICGNAAAAEIYPANPDQAIIRKLDQLGNKIGRRSGGALIKGVTVTETQTPSLDRHGKWTIALTEAPDGETLTEISVAIQSPDPDPDVEFSTEYQITMTGNTAESCDFVAPGNYRIVAYYFFSGGTCYMGYQDFSISLDETHTAEDYPTLAQKVSQIVAECQVAGNDWQTALNLHDWLTHHVCYDWTYSFYGAEDALLRGTGVCDSYSKAYCYLLREAGITVQRVNSDTHAWNVITLGNTEYHVDVTWDDPVMADESGQIINELVSGGEQYVYFCINDDLIYGFLDERAEHATGKTYTGATSLAESYLIHTNKWQDGGQYWDDEVGNLGLYRDLIVDCIPNEAVGAFTVPADQDCIIEILDDSKVSACHGNEVYAKWARYIYAYKLNETGIPGLDGFTVAYDPEEMVFRATVGDGMILIDNAGGILQNGDSLSGKIRYKIRVANLPAGCDKLQFTWDDQNLNATAPAGWQDDWRGLEHQDGKNYIYLLPELIETYNSEVMFVRTGENDQNHRYITLNYNRTPKYDIPVTITNTETPAYGENDYMLTWTGADTADYCIVIWEKPDGKWEMFFCGTDGLRLGDLLENWKPLDQIGNYQATVFPIKDDRIWMRPTAWPFTVVAPEPVLRVDSVNNAAMVIVLDDGSVTAPMHQWIHFDVWAPGSEGVVIFWLDSVPGDLSEGQSFNDLIENGTLPGYVRYTECRPGDEWEKFTWTPNDLPDGWTSGNYVNYVVAEACYENGTKFKRVNIPVTVVVNTTITGTVEFCVPDNIVPRDGQLIIEVDNTANDADFYGAYILKDGYEDRGRKSDHYWDWLVDSHWVTKESNEGTTQVQLPVSRCEAYEDYFVHVYAVKIGALQIESAEPAPSHVLEAETEWTPGFPKSITPGQDVIVTHDPVEGAESYNAGIWDMSAKRCIYSIERTEPGDFIFPFALFADGGDFNLGIGVSDGVCSDWRWTDVYYEDIPSYQDGEALTLSTTSTSLEPGSNVNLTISTADVEQVIVEAHEMFADSHQPAGQKGSLLEYWRVVEILDQPGTAFGITMPDYSDKGETTDQLRAAVKKNGRWSAWSNPIATEAPEAPQIQIEPEKPQADQLVTFRFDQQYEALRIGLYKDGRYSFGREEENRDSITWGSPLSAGDWSVHASVCVDGVWSRISETAFRVYDKLDPKKLTTLDLPDDLTKIEDYAFEGGAFEAVIIPDKCTRIGTGAFRNCKNLIYVSYPEGLDLNKEEAFFGCDIIMWVVR